MKKKTLCFGCFERWEKERQQLLDKWMWRQYGFEKSKYIVPLRGSSGSKPSTNIRENTTNRENNSRLMRMNQIK
jgi:hypothetical protein